MASPTTIAAKLYENPLRRNGFDVVLPSVRQQKTTESVIRAVIAGESLGPLRVRLRRIMSSLHLQGAEVVILGCTELSVVFAKNDVGMVDPLTIATNKLLGERI